ncbi:MFS transporter [Sphingomonas jatrophae]|uniref:MFS transporter, DHA2 family, multidrug resistance protein n=1 Tax=Sphingomonas jatrophae TaxID=1166337 RepID=A0A1I6JXA9_9SPHN|nr:MFS transporter [Sphingomonas jatrophae]SFR83160.1 MFS transporter, DHA2 family, multidrug resistance protein [Sphingomonas jatrophae]
MTDGLPMPRRLRAIVAISLGSALTMIDGAIATVALPTIAADLGTSPAAAVLVVTVYQLTLVTTLLPLSALGDRIGLRRLYQGGQLLFAAATLLCFFARSLPFLLVVRVAQALGAAAALSVSSALVRSIYPARMLGRGLGINTVVIASAGALAPTLGGFVLSVAPWPWIFASTLPFALMSLAIGRALPDPEPHDEPYDLAGALLSACTFGLTVAGLEALVHGDSPVVATAIIVAGLVAGVVFVRRELGDPRPILPVDLLARPVFALSVAGALTAFLASMTFLLSLPFRLKHGWQFTPGQTGAAMMFWPATSMVVAPLSGALSDRYPAGLLGAIGMVMAVGGLLALAFLPAEAGVIDVGWRMSLTGAGFGMFLSPNARLILGSTPRERTASAGGLISTTRLLGQTLGATLAAALLATGLGASRTPALVAAGLAALAGLASAARLRPAVRLPAMEEVADAQPEGAVR